MERKRKENEPKLTLCKPVVMNPNVKGYPVKLELRKNHEYHFTVAAINCKFKTHNVSDNSPSSEVDSDIEKFKKDKKIPRFFPDGCYTELSDNEPENDDSNNGCYTEVPDNDYSNNDKNDTSDNDSNDDKNDTSEYRIRWR